MTLECTEPNAIIRNISFASFGLPTGKCFTDGSPNTFKKSKCDASNSVEVFEKLCVGKKQCTFDLELSLFKGCDHCLPDGDPCKCSRSLCVFFRRMPKQRLYRPQRGEAPRPRRRLRSGSSRARSSGS